MRRKVVDTRLALMWLSRYQQRVKAYDGGCWSLTEGADGDVRMALDGLAVRNASTNCSDR